MALLAQNLSTREILVEFAFVDVPASTEQTPKALEAWSIGHWAVVDFGSLLGFGLLVFVCVELLIVGVGLIVQGSAAKGHQYGESQQE